MLVCDWLPPTLESAPNCPVALFALAYMSPSPRPGNRPVGLVSSWAVALQARVCVWFGICWAPSVTVSTPDFWPSGRGLNPGPVLSPE